MTVIEAIKIWEEYNRRLIEEMRDHKSNEYKNGYCDGLESAVEALLAYVSDCETDKG